MEQPVISRVVRGSSPEEGSMIQRLEKCPEARHTGQGMEAEPKRMVFAVD